MSQHDIANGASSRYTKNHYDHTTIHDTVQTDDVSRFTEWSPVVIVLQQYLSPKQDQEGLVKCVQDGRKDKLVFICRADLRTKVNDTPT